MDQLTDLASTRFECGKEHLIGLRAAEPGGPSLVLTQAEFHELWTRMWSDVSDVAALFQGDKTKNSLFQLTAGQVIALDWMMPSTNIQAQLILLNIFCSA